MKFLRIFFTLVGFLFGLYLLWSIWRGAVVTDWQEYARACFGILAYLGIVNLIAQLWK